MNAKKIQLENNVVYYQARLAHLNNGLATCNDGRIRATEEAEKQYWENKESFCISEILVAQEELKQSMEILEELKQTIKKINSQLNNLQKWQL